jgi:putative ABC transport system substrate-binding protein
MVLDDAFMAEHEETILRLASGVRLPAVLGPKPRGAQGALISYAPDYLDQFRRAAGYVDKILKGALPANLPIEQPTRFELVINLKIARTLGLTIPQSVLLQASEVIE